MREEVIANQETKENKVIYDTLSIVAKRYLGVFELQTDVFPYYSDFNVLILDLSLDYRFINSVVVAALISHMPVLFTFVAKLVFCLHESFSQDKKVWLVRCKS